MVDKVVSVGIGLMSTHGFESPPVPTFETLCHVPSGLKLPTCHPRHLSSSCICNKNELWWGAWAFFKVKKAPL